MEEQKDLDDLKKLMAEQQAKPASTMAEMEIKATTLQEKLDKKSELSKSNAKAGVKKVALEYKVVELDLNIKPPPGFKFGEPDEKTTAFPTNKRGFNSAQVKNAFGNASKGGGIQFSAFGQPDPTSKEFEDQAVRQDMKNEAKKRFSDFEKATLKELGEDGWTLRSTVRGSHDIADSKLLYYFSRPL